MELMPRPEGTGAGAMAASGGTGVPARLLMSTPVKRAENHQGAEVRTRPLRKLERKH